MQATLARRFTVCALVVLGTTLFPWFLYDLLWKQDYSLKFGLDLKGGASITYRVAAGEGQDQAGVLQDAIRITQFRVDRFGVSEVNIVESGEDQFTVELPGRGKEEIDRIKSIMSKVGSLEFRIRAEGRLEGAQRQLRAQKQEKKEPYEPPAGYEWYPAEHPEHYGHPDLLLEVPDKRAEAELRKAEAELAAAVEAGKPEADLAPLRAAVDAKKEAFDRAAYEFRWTGEDLASTAARRVDITRGTGYEVWFEMVPGRQSAFGDFTGKNVEREMAIVLNGQVHTAPVIRSKLPGGGTISSDANPYTQETAQDLVTVLQSGSLQAKPEEISSFVVGPGLGEDAVRRGRIAVGLSFLLVIGLMAWLYRGSGWVANLALLFNLVITLSILVFLGAALSLPGIAGLILTLGMAVDANILVFERIREEKAAGKGLLQALTAGYDRAFITIVDSNLTTVISAAILYWIGTGPVRGFALTLILGLFISMFTALYLTRTLFLWGLEKGVLKEFRMIRILGRKQYPFMGLRAPLIRVSLALLVLGTGAFIARAPDDKYDLEFTGGQRVVLSFQQPLEIARVREVLAQSGYPEAGVRTVRGRGSETEGLDLTSRSNAFEITARIRDTAEGRSFTARMEEAFASELVPEALQEFRFVPATEGKPATFSAVLNFETEGVGADRVREVLGASPLVAPEGLEVTPVPGIPGQSAFRVAGASTAAAEGTLRDGINHRVETTEGIDLSEPVPQSDFIGPGVARRLRDEAILAVILSILVQILYLRLRFRDFTYGFAAAIALVHDVLITLGAVAVFDALGLVHVKINLPVIAAFLTLVGFSMNDTIVIFDRIRENLGRAIHPSTGLLDQAVNQTLARSIRTSATTFLVAVTLLFVNYGAASSLEGFGFVMSVGVLTGTYSSIAIASPLLLFLPVYLRRLLGFGKWVVAGLVVAMFGGIAVAVAYDALAPTLAGIAFGSLLPLHFIVHLLRWLGRDDPDRLVTEAVGKQLVGGVG